MEKHGRYSYTPFVVYSPFSSPRPPLSAFLLPAQVPGSPFFFIRSLRGVLQFCNASSSVLV